MTNVGTIDRGPIHRRARAYRTFILAAKRSSFADLGFWRWALTIVGVVMITAAAIRFCPAYTLLGMNTCGRT